MKSLFGRFSQGFFCFDLLKQFLIFRLIKRLIICFKQIKRKQGHLRENIECFLTPNLKCKIRSEGFYQKKSELNFLIFSDQFQNLLIKRKVNEQIENENFKKFFGKFLKLKEKRFTTPKKKRSDENYRSNEGLCCRICLETIEIKNFSLHAEKCFEMTEVRKKLKELRNELDELSRFLEESKLKLTTQAKKDL